MKPPLRKETPFMRTLAALALAVLAFAGPAGGQSAPSPYAGQEARDVKTLAPEDLASLLAGDGMGLARAAELNHYPGPRHVLDLSAPLGLTEDQRRATQAAFERMKAEARRIGAAVVERERRLDALFASGGADEARVRRLAAEIGALTGELRAVHLTAHLETRRVLGAHQVALYDRLRGYDGGRAGQAREPAAGHGGHRP